MSYSGIRVKGDLKKLLSEFVAGINESDSSIISVDIPPGFCLQLNEDLVSPFWSQILPMHLHLVRRKGSVHFGEA